MARAASAGCRRSPARCAWRAKATRSPSRRRPAPSGWRSSRSAIPTRMPAAKRRAMPRARGITRLVVAGSAGASVVRFKRNGPNGVIARRHRRRSNPGPTAHCMSLDCFAATKIAARSKRPLSQLCASPHLTPALPAPGGGEGGVQSGTPVTVLSGHIGNTSALRVRLGRAAGACPRCALRKFAGGVDTAEFDWAIVHGPEAVGDFAEADRLAGERLADVDKVAEPFDLASVADVADIASVRIVRRAQAAIPGAPQWLIDACRRLLAQRLVRPFRVEDAAECVEAALLGASACRRRARSFFLERAMQPLVPAVLLRLAGRDPLRQHAGLDQLHGERRQAAGADPGERRPVVAAYHARQAELAESRIEHRPDVPRVRALHHLQPQHIAAVQIAQAEGITAPPIAGAEPALEIRAPPIVAGGAGGQRRGTGRNPAAPLPPHHQTMPVEQLGDRALDRPARLWPAC